jgi:hypothetical protein
MTISLLSVKEKRVEQLPGSSAMDWEPDIDMYHQDVDVPPISVLPSSSVLDVVSGVESP